MVFKSWLSIVFSCFLLLFVNAVHASSIKFLSSKYFVFDEINKKKAGSIINEHFKLDNYRQIAVQVITNSAQKPEYLLIYLFSKKFHKVDFVKINIDSHFNFTSITHGYHLSAGDNLQQPGISARQASCPDPSIEFITFAPNDDDLEQEVTLDVLNAAKSHRLKTVNLIRAEATRSNYLNYMKCPLLKGNFYDGDANPEVITTVDGLLTYEDINTELQSQFRFKAVHIWLACQAFNDPLKTSMLITAQAQKYAAGINNLLVGPSDWAANCSMKAALDGKPMTASFWDCYAKYDTSEDHWGFGGEGSDFFGV